MNIRTESSSPNNWTNTGVTRDESDSADGRNDQVSESAEKPQLFPSPEFANWLASTGGSLMFSTYQSGRLFLLGTNENKQLQAIDRAVGTAMGLAVDNKKLWIGTREQIWRFSNTGAVNINGQSYQAAYMPRTCNMVGNSNTHDVLADVTFRGKHYEFLYANTQYSCIAAPDPHYSFRPVWTPDFISELVPEDRCHLNGIGERDGELRYATFCGRTNTQLGWKEKRTGTGFIMDLKSEEIVCEGLSMPHSPRWHNDKLWVLNSGEGELGYVDFATRQFVPIANCAGFARGLSFIGNYAVVGLSRLRPKKSDGLGINLEQKLHERNVMQRCGLQIFDLQNGQLMHWLTIDGPVTELYDVAFLAEISNPYSPGFREPELHRTQMNIPPQEQPSVSEQ